MENTAAAGLRLRRRLAPRGDRARRAENRPPEERKATMNEKEISEIRRRFRPDKSNITHVRGCYVNERQEIVAAFDQSLALLPQEESENLLAVLRRTLSGTLGKNLIDMPFSTAQVVDSDEHRLLMALRDSALNDEAAVSALFEKIIAAYRPEGTYLILLAHDTYDVPFRSRDGERQDDASSETYSYVLCSICPVKDGKAGTGLFAPGIMNSTVV